MAGDWLKVEKDTPDKPEILAMAGILFMSPDTVFGKCFRFWRWADSHTTNGTFRGITAETIDALVSCENFADAMSKVGWLSLKNGVARIPDFDRHFGEGAKQRALTAKRVAKHKAKKGNGEVTPDALPTKEKRTKEQQGEPDDYGQPDTKPPNGVPLTLDARGVGEGKFQISDQQWDRILSMAENVARKIPPNNEKGRRCWFKYAALAEVRFSEHWLMDAVEGVRQAARTKGTPQGHFVGILKRNAQAKFSVDGAGFAALMKRIEVPPHIWHSANLEIEA